MATMMMPMPCQEVYEFELAEKKVERADAGITFAQGMNLVIRSAFALVHLTSALESAVAAQADLIAKLTHSVVQEFTSDQLQVLASKIEHLVALNEHLLATAPNVKFRRLNKYLDRVQDQTEHLSGIAESFRMAGDDEALGILAFIAKDITAASSEQLVGEMHA